VKNKPDPSNLLRKWLPPFASESLTDTMQATGLPSEWEIRFSKTRQIPYYFNRDTNESRWEPPSGSDISTLQAYLTANYSPNDTKIRVRHLLVKHSKSRRPSSWKEVPHSPHPCLDQTNLYRKILLGLQKKHGGFWNHIKHELTLVLYRWANLPLQRVIVIVTVNMGI
jgi:WW domain